jgi:protein-tyrosine-phosphatase/predicted ATP-grasp superfamily ATP-dependent carboligase
MAHTRTKRLTILVTDAHELAGLGAIRSLGRAGHCVIAAYPEGRQPPPSVRSRYCGGSARYPDPWKQQFAFRDWLVAAAHRGDFDAVLPVAESAVAAVAAVRDRLSQNVLPILASDAALRYSLSKYHATAMAQAAGIPCPRTVFVHDGTPTGVWNDDLTPLVFPVILKTDNHVTAEGVYVRGRKFIVSTPDGAAEVLRQYRGEPIALIAQEVIPGTGAGAFLLRFGGTTYLTFAHRRLHEIPYWGGYSSFRESCRDEALTTLGARVLDAADYDGVAMVEFRRSSRDGAPYFLEINGRLWGSLALALHAGADFPRALVECYLQGRPEPQRPYRSGVRCRNVFSGEVKHVRSILSARRPAYAVPSASRVRAVLGFVALSFDPRVHHDHLWLSDPMPGIANIRNAARWALEEGREYAAARVRRRRDERLLRRLRAAHEARTRQRYFPDRLSRIAFVCFGNICRSAFAEQYWMARARALGVAAPEVVSLGFHEQAGRRSPDAYAALARRYGVDLTEHRSRTVDDATIRSADAVFVMDLKNYRQLTRRFPWAAAKTHLLGSFGGGSDEIRDPYNMSDADASAIIEQMIAAIDGLLAVVAKSEAAREVA